MGVGRKGEARCIVEPPNAQTEMARDAALHRRHHLVKDKGPLAIGQPRRVLPAVELRLEGDVWPAVVAVGGEMQALRRRVQAASEVRLVAGGGRQVVTLRGPRSGRPEGDLGTERKRVV